jgi:hypothetical protein
MGHTRNFVLKMQTYLFDHSEFGIWDVTFDNEYIFIAILGVE